MNAFPYGKGHKEFGTHPRDREDAAVDHDQVMREHASLMEQLEIEKKHAEELSTMKRISGIAPTSPTDTSTDDFTQISQMVNRSASLPPPLPVDLTGLNQQNVAARGQAIEYAHKEVEDAQPEGQQSISDIEVMRRTIMEALNTERHRAELLEEDVNMTKLEKDAEIDEYKLAISRLKAQIRILVSERSLDEVYDVLEEDIARLTRELEMTRARNVVLENKMLDHLLTTHSSKNGPEEAISFLDVDSDAREFSFSHTLAPGHPGPGPGQSASFLCDTTGLSKKESKRLIAQVKHLNTTVETLKKENEALRSTQRLHNISVRQTKDAARRVYLASQQADRAKSEYEKEHNEHVATSKCLTMVRSEVGALHDENRDLKKANDKLTLQVASLKRDISELESKRKRERKLSNFVMKHVPGAKDTSIISHRGVGAASKSYKEDTDDHELLQDDDDDVNRSFRKSIRKTQTEAQKLRSLQKHKMDEGVVNDVLTELRAEAVFRAPAMLPTIRHLIKVLHEEREIWRYMSAVVKEVNIGNHKK